MDYTKEDMDRLLDYSCERAAGDTLKGIDSLVLPRSRHQGMCCRT